MKNEQSISLKRKIEKLLEPASYIFLGLGLLISLYYILILWIGGYHFWGNIDKDAISVVGQVGDFMGGVVGSLWALTGVLLFYVALTLQRKELNNQINELKETKEVFKVQQFENVFFNLIKTQHEITNQIEADIAKLDIPKHYKGKELVSILKIKYQIIYKECKVNQGIERIRVSYSSFFNQYHDHLGHYFRHLYHIYKYIRTAEENEIQEITGIKDFQERSLEIENRYNSYAGFIQAQMSSAELFLLFYNGLCFPEMKKLIIKFNQLENLAKEDLLDPDGHANLYEGVNLKARGSIVNYA